MEEVKIVDKEIVSEDEDKEKEEEEDEDDDDDDELQLSEKRVILSDDEHDYVPEYYRNHPFQNDNQIINNNEHTSNINSIQVASYQDGRNGFKDTQLSQNQKSNGVHLEDNQNQNQDHNQGTTKLALKLNTDLLEESYMQKELVDNLEEFSPISRMEDSRADVTAQLFDLSIMNGKKISQSNGSSFASKTYQGQSEGYQQQSQYQGSKGDQKNQKLRERFEKYSSQMKNNINSKNKSDSVSRQSQIQKSNQKIEQTPVESQQQQNAGNLDNIQRNQLRQQVRQLSLSNYSKPTVSSQQKQEAPKTERISSANKSRQNFLLPPHQQKNNSKSTVNGQKQGQKHTVIQQDSIPQQSQQQQYLGRYQIPSSSSLSPSRRKTEKKNLTSREDYEVASKIRPSSQRTSPSRNYQADEQQQQYFRNRDYQQVSKFREKQQYLEDEQEQKQQIEQEMQELREDEGQLRIDHNDNIVWKDCDYVEGDVGGQKQHEEQENEGLEINIYKQEESLKKKKSKGDSEEYKHQQVVNISQDKIQRSDSNDGKNNQGQQSYREDNTLERLTENDDHLQSNDQKLNTAQDVELKQIEEQDNKIIEQSENINQNILSNHNRNRIQQEEQVVLPNQTSSPLKTGIIPKILNFKQFIDNNNNNSNTQDIHIQNTDNVCISQSAKHIPMTDETKLKDHLASDGAKSARISTRTKHDLNVVTKGTSSKDISAKSSPRQDHSSACSFKKSNSIFSPIKKSALNMVYLIQDEHKKPQVINSGQKQSLQNSSSRNNQQKYFIDLEIQNTKKDQQQSEMSASISKQMHSNTNNGNVSQQSVMMSATPRGQHKQSLNKIAIQQICDQQKGAKLQQSQQQIIQLKNAGTVSSCSTSTSQNPQNSRNTPSNSISSAKQIFEEENNKQKIDLVTVGGGNQLKEVQTQGAAVKSIINPQGIPQLAQQQIMQLQIQQQQSQNANAQPTYYAQQFQQKQAGRGVGQTPKDIGSYKKEQILRKSSDFKEYDVIDKANAAVNRKGINGNLRGSTKDEYESFQRILSSSQSKTVRENNTSINKQLFNQNSFLTDNINSNNRSELKTLQNFFHSNSEVYCNNNTSNNQQQQQPTNETISQHQRQAQQQQNTSKSERISNTSSSQFYQGSFIQPSSTQNGFSKLNPASNNCRNQQQYQSDISVSSSSRGYCSQTHYQQNVSGQIEKHHTNDMEEQILQLAQGGTQGGNTIEKQAKSIQKVLNSCLQPASLTARTSQTFQTYSSREATKRNNNNNNTNNYSKVKNRSEVNVDHIVQHLLDVNKLSSNQNSSRQEGNSSGIGLHSRQNKSAASNTSNSNYTNSSNTSNNINGSKNYEALKESIQKYTNYLKNNNSNQRENKKQVITPQVLSDIERDQLNYKIQQAEQEIARISKLRNRYSVENQQLEVQNEFLRLENQK